jgi:acylphosphatase
MAERFAVRGWVRNEPDGSVRCEVAGEPSEIEAFLAAVEEAMRGNVTSREGAAVSRSDLSGGGFEIRH